MNSNTAIAPAPVQKLTAAELEQGRRYLEQATTGVFAATAGLSEAQWNFKPAPERWSIAENVEHMVLVQELVLGPIREQLAGSPVINENPHEKRVDTIVFHQLTDRSLRFKAPAFIEPTGSMAPPVALERLVTNSRRLMEYLESTPGLRRHFRESPPLKAVTKGELQDMDGYQWALVTAAHNERHTLQIMEVKADSNFPR